MAARTVKYSIKHFRPDVRAEKKLGLVIFIISLPWFTCSLYTLASQNVYPVAQKEKNSGVRT
jgi:hypothetical protein